MKRLEDTLLEMSLQKNISRVALLGYFSKADTFRSLDIESVQSVIVSIINILKPKQITLFEKQFSDTDSSIQIYANQFSIDYRYINSNSLTKCIVKDSSIPFNNIYIDTELMQYDIVVIITKAHLHKHHFLIYPWSPLEEFSLSLGLSNYDWRSSSRRESISILRDELNTIFDVFKSIHLHLQLLGVLNATDTLMTNEHIFFYKKHFKSDIYIEKDLVLLQSRLLELLK